MYSSAKKMFENGKSLRQISKETGIDRKLLSRMLKEDGCEITPRGITTGKGKYSHNLNAFKKIDNELSAYWLGFLFADGAINMRSAFNLELTLSKKDKNHIEKFVEFVSPDVPIKDKVVSLNGKKYYASRAHICSKEIVEDLVSHGCTETKSLTLEFPEIPKDMVHHFMRGYFDGDGSICIRKDNQKLINLVGTHEFLEAYRDILFKQAGVNKTKIRKVSNASQIAYAGNRVVKKIYEFLYKDATVFLERKKEKFAVLPQNTTEVVGS